MRGKDELSIHPHTNCQSGRSQNYFPGNSQGKNTHISNLVSDDDRILLDVNAADIIQRVRNNEEVPSFEMAGPRNKIYFDPSKLKCALVTCGGLCPGLNDIIRAIVLELYYGYGVRHIFGIRYGLQGFIPKFGHDIYELNPNQVTNIMEMGDRFWDRPGAHSPLMKSWTAWNG